MTGTPPPRAGNDDPDFDVIIVGAGIAGLSAAHRLRHHRILVLEAADRVGGRICSVPSGDFWLNFGAHMFGGPTTVVGDLIAELGLETRPIRGKLFGLIWRGRRMLGGSSETLPLRLPLRLSARISLARMGLKLRTGSARIVRELGARQGESAGQRLERLHHIEDARTLADYIGPLDPEVSTLLDAITERTGASPRVMAAGYALRSFGNVWSSSAPGYNLFGGSARLPRAIARGLGDAVLLNARAEAVRARGSWVEVAYTANGVRKMVRAWGCVVAVPAFEARRLAHDLPERTRAALDAISYGPFLSVAMRTRETRAMPWDSTYAVSTPGLSFSVVFNQGTTALPTGAPKVGGSLMLFRGAAGAKQLMERDDPEILARCLTDLEGAFPEAKDIVTYAEVKRWECGVPYAKPGRGALQKYLMQRLERVCLAGDYLDFPNMEAAVSTGFEAARYISRFLPGERPDGGHAGGSNSPRWKADR